MFCDRCQEQPKPWQVFQVWQTNLDACQGDLSRLATLCGACLVGETVPAYRPTLQRWHLGQVQAWRNNVDTVSGEACLCFDGNTATTEWLHLESAPFDAYSCNVREWRENEMIRLDNDMHDEDSQNLGDTFHLSAPESPASLFRGGLHTSEKENSTEATAQSPPPFATASPYRTLPPIFERNSEVERNSEDDYLSEEETTNQKACPRLWTIDEDQLLRRAVLECPYPLKWPDIANLVPKRTGKQCRERYTNHLKPTLKLSEWSPIEDALTCRLHASLGSKWATIARFLPGRTDNGIKNRFHHIRRRYEKATTRIGRNVQLEEKILQRTKNTAAPDPLMLSLVRGASDMPIVDSATDDTTASFFGTFFVPAGVLCTRCNLFAPSRQTGNTVCKKTGWCKSCVDAPVYLCGDVLRLQHVLYDSTPDPNRISLCSDRE